MRKVVGLLLCVLLLTGCSQSIDEIQQGMTLRGRLLKAASCSFDAQITADYGDVVHTFSMSCQADALGNLRFTVTEPQTIAGVTGAFQGEKGKLTYDGLALQFNPLTDEQISPVSAPWVMMKTLLGGYITSGCREQEGIRLTIDDSYAEGALTLDVWLNEEGVPKRAEILYEGRRILTVSVSNFGIA